LLWQGLDMPSVVQSFRAQAEAQSRELLQAIEAAEGVIVSSIERECEALRAGQMLAAQALRIRLRDAAKLYVNLIRAARASLWTLEQVLPGIGQHLDSRRAAFGALLRVELAVLAAERAASEPAPDMMANLPPNVTPIRGARRHRQRRRRIA
jgi:hypothetical protein